VGLAVQDIRALQRPVLDRAAVAPPICTPHCGVRGTRVAARRPPPHAPTPDPRRDGSIRLARCRLPVDRDPTPGALLFDRLYTLPYGWLLQGPGRFLLLAGVGYVVMAATTVGEWFKQLEHHARAVKAWTSRRRIVVKATIASTIVGTGALLPGYPIAFGAIASGPHVGSSYSAHVRVPQYWTAMTNYLNSPSAPPGNLLILPPNSFYQVPYTWGYYGNDGFITDMVRRPVVDPSGQGYGASSTSLLTAVDQVAQALLAGNEVVANGILRAMGTSEVLVREDVATNFPMRPVVSPKALARALAQDPQASLIHCSGSLLLYRVHGVSSRAVGHGVPYATAQTATPDLLMLGLLRSGSVIVRHTSIPGVPDLVPVPAPNTWHIYGNTLSKRVALPKGRSYALARLSAAGARLTPLPPAGRTTRAGALHARTVTTASGAFAELSVPTRGQDLTDGTFRSGPWGAVGNCNNAPTATPRICTPPWALPRREQAADRSYCRPAGTPPARAGRSTGTAAPC